jgi:hypothetical protein
MMVGPAARALLPGVLIGGGVRGGEGRVRRKKEQNRGGFGWISIGFEVSRRVFF